MTKQAMISVRIPDEWHERLFDLARNHGVTVSEYVRRIITDTETGNVKK